MTKPKDFVKIRLPRFLATTVVMLASCLGVTAQSTAKPFDARMLPSLNSLSTGEDIDRVERQMDILEKNVFKDTRADKDQYCDALFNFVVFRYRLHRATPTLPAAPAYNAPEAKAWLSFRDLLDKNIMRAEELFTEGEKGCSQVGGKPTEAYLMAKFADTWLLDNTRASLAQRLTRAGDQPKLDKKADERLGDYDFVLKEFRSRSDKTWIDPILLLLTYSNALVRRDQFETAEPLLTECLAIANQKFGANSPTLLPILRLLAGITRLAGDEAEHQRYMEWIGRLGVPEKEQEIVFDLRSRANPESVTALSLENKILIAGPRDDLGRPPDIYLGIYQYKSGYEFPMADLPFAPGQGIRDNRVWSDSQFSQFAVRASVTVNESGDVTSIDVQNSNPKINDRVLKVAKGLKFKPLTYKGRATTMKGFVGVWVRYDYK